MAARLAAETASTITHAISPTILGRDPNDLSGGSSLPSSGAGVSAVAFVRLGANHPAREAIPGSFRRSPAESAAPGRERDRNHRAPAWTAHLSIIYAYPREPKKTLTADSYAEGLPILDHLSHAR